MNLLKKVETVEKLQQYIKANLTKPISLTELSQVACHSPAYTARLFKEVSGYSAFGYIRRLRLSQAALVLRDQETKVVDVAFDFVFASHEGFTRAFSKQFGVSPKQYAMSPSPIRLFMPQGVKHLYLSQQKRGKKMSELSQTIFVQVINQPKRTMLVARAKTAKHYFEYCEELDCDVWSTLCSVKEALAEPLGLWLPESLRPEGTSEYVQAVEVPEDYAVELPKGFELCELPACQMMVFQGQAFADEDYGEAISLLWQEIDRYDPKLYGFDWAPETGPRFQMEPQGYRGYIEGRPVVAIS